jgi:hypothetical protein
MQEIIIKVGGVKYRINVLKQKKFILYSLMRNKRCLMTGQCPLKMKETIKPSLMIHLNEQILWEIANELEKIKI